MGNKAKQVTAVGAGETKITIVSKLDKNKKASVIVTVTPNGEVIFNYDTYYIVVPVVFRVFCTIFVARRFYTVQLSVL